MTGTPLPNASVAVVPDAKVRDYLLEPTHPDNCGKAGFFNAFGFTARDWQHLRDALHQHAGMHPVIKERPTQYGITYEVRCNLPSPDGRNPCVRSFWAIDAANPSPRLITAYPY
jgi:hypothetical protein